jgi:acetyl esterase/lipase
LTNAAAAIVVSTHYRQAPEHKFPAAHEDVFAAYKWTLANAASFNGDPARVAVAGESAGGNMAAATAIRARDEHLAAPVHQLLIYPVADASMATESYQENAAAKPLSKAAMQWFASQAFASPAAAKDPRITLVAVENLKGLPPATVIPAQIDPLRSEGQRYAERLRQAGVPVRWRNFDAVTHEFFGMGAAVDAAKEAVGYAAEGLKESFARRQGS